MIYVKKYLRISCFYNHFSFLQDFNIKIAVSFEQLQLLETDKKQTDMATTRLKWPRGRLSENYCPLSKWTSAPVRSEVTTAPRLHCSTGSRAGTR